MGLFGFDNFKDMFDYGGAGSKPLFNDYDDYLQDYRDRHGQDDREASRHTFANNFDGVKSTQPNGVANKSSTVLDLLQGNQNISCCDLGDEYVTDICAAQAVKPFGFGKCSFCPALEASLSAASGT